MPLFRPNEEAVQKVLNYFYKSYISDISLITGLTLSGSTVSSISPLKIMDLNGKSLFFDFKINDRNGKKIGVVRSSARGAELPLIDAIMIGEQLFEEDTARLNIVAAASQDYPGGQFEIVNFVCYGYPMVGILLRGTHDGRVFHVIYDAHLERRVDEIDINDTAKQPGEESGSDAAGEPLEGNPIYSFDANIPEAGPDDYYSEDWFNAFKIATAIESPPSVALASPFSVEAEVLFEAANVLESSISENDIPKPAMQGITLPIRLIGQETPVYCAVATGQMILSYMGIDSYDQTAIAEAFGTGPRGTSSSKFNAGLKHLLADHYIPTTDFTPTQIEMSTYLRNYMPAKSGIPGHARLLRGWREYAHFNPKTGKPELKTGFYLVNDPYPTGSGQYVMEAINKPIDDFYRNMVTLEAV